MEVWLGFSFLMRKVSGDQYDIVYAYAARELPFAKMKVTDKVENIRLFKILNFFQTEWKLFESLVENREHSDFLFGTFVATQVFSS